LLTPLLLQLWNFDSDIIGLMVFLVGLALFLGGLLVKGVRGKSK
jgi:hypothetical protein